MDRIYWVTAFQRQHPKTNQAPMTSIFNCNKQ